MSWRTVTQTGTPSGSGGHPVARHPVRKPKPAPRPDDVSAEPSFHASEAQEQRHRRGVHGEAGAARP
eukprot:6952376-Prorocentrum_lima.AAC.1